MTETLVTYSYRLTSATSFARDKSSLNIIDLFFDLILTAIADEIMANRLKQLFPRADELSFHKTLQAGTVVAPNAALPIQ